MKKLHEYEEHARKCREMASTAPASHKPQLEQMAATWEQLAVVRKRLLKKDGKFSGDKLRDSTSDDGKTAGRPD